MRCPFCTIQDTRVIDSRLANEGDQVRRRRECLNCKARFTTYEAAELNLPRVVKKDGSREPFYEQKLRQGLQHALEKRPVDSDRIEALINLIEKNLLMLGEREIPSQQIGELVMKELAALDHVAYVRFASVYCSFQDINEFRDLIERIEQQQ